MTYADHSAQSLEGSVCPVTGRSTRSVAVVACCLSLCGGERAFAQVLRGAGAFGSWQDDKRGVRRFFTAQKRALVSKSLNGGAQVVPMPAGARPQVPDGFSVELVTSDPRDARAIRVAPNGG